MSTYIIGALVFGLLTFICIRLVKAKKSGNACASCGGCSNAVHCKGQRTH